MLCSASFGTINATFYKASAGRRVEILSSHADQKEGNLAKFVLVSCEISERYEGYEHQRAKITQNRQLHNILKGFRVGIMRRESREALAALQLRHLIGIRHPLELHLCRHSVSTYQAANQAHFRPVNLAQSFWFCCVSGSPSWGGSPSHGPSHGLSWGAIMSDEVLYGER